jgi:hypothetical protein
MKGRNNLWFTLIMLNVLTLPHMSKRRAMTQLLSVKYFFERRMWGKLVISVFLCLNIVKPESCNI